MRFVASFVALTLGTGFTFAAEAQAHAPSIVLVAPAYGQNCPVGLRARRLPGGGLSEVNTAPATHRPALHLTFAATDRHAVVQADVILHGNAGQGFVPANEATAGHQTEVFTVTLSSGANQASSSVLYPKTLTAVDLVELKELTFADGSRWHASANSTCRVVPDNFRLVASGN